MKKLNENGFTLIEVLISLMILAGGLLGYLGLQATGLKNTMSSYHRSQATQMIYDMTDRIRVNKSAADNYLTSFMSSSSAAEQSDCIIVSTTCSNEDMAQNDLYLWNQQLTSNQLLPSGSGTITVSGSIYTISVTWDDNRDGSVNSSDPSLQVSFFL